MTTLEKIDKLRVQRGWSIYKLSTLRAICDAFEISLSEFFEEDSESEAEIDKSLQRKISKLTYSQKKALISFLKSM